jgi:2-polyprenyl-6-methoxyphenol hydroxylase-like FAD-dependent oxidoreductase
VQLLEERAREVGAEIRRGHEVGGLQQDAQGVTVEVRNRSGQYELRCQYLAGCDGAHSVVRKHVDSAFSGMEPTVVGRMGDVKLGVEALELLKQGLPALGGRDFGIARTRTGNFAIVPMGSEIYRLAAIEWDQSLPDRDASMDLGELQAAVRRVTGLNVRMSDPVWLSRPTDSSRLVDRYRIGRVFLGGDAAHVHWAYGGKGMQTGLQDAGNLGWKLAAQIQGWAPRDLLDTYHSERHPIGQRLMTFTRAQEALARPGDHVTALRELFSRLLSREQTFRTIAEEMTDVDICYEMGGNGGSRHPMLGRWAPNLTLDLEPGTTHVARLMCAGKGVFLDMANRSELCVVAQQWADRVESISARCSGQSDAIVAMLIRPDGYVAWVDRTSDPDSESAAATLRAAFERWFGSASLP